jgi:replicative DNA helicase
MNELTTYGKVPPQAIDMEEAVIGGMMLDKDAAITISAILVPESFYKETNRKIFASIQTLVRKNLPVDILTVTEQLRSISELESVGGPVYITTLLSKINSACNIEYHSRIVIQKYMQRELIRISTEIQTKSFDDSIDISEILEFAESSIFSVTQNNMQREPKHVGEIANNVLIQIQKIVNHEIKLIGSPSGFTMLDRSTGGFKQKELTIIAGRPSMGKTALAIQICKNTAILNTPVCLFSIEMGEDEVGRRLISGYTNKSNIQLINGQCDPVRLAELSEPLFGLPIFIDETSGIGLLELRAKTRKLIAKHGVKIIIVDYIGLMKAEGYNRENEISNVSRGLKSIAKDLNIAVIALSQLNRGLEKTESKKPKLSDLRDSGAIEQDADVVMFVHRPEKHGQKTYDLGNDILDSKNLTILILAKNRNGATSEIPLRNNDFMTDIYDFETISYELPY